MHGLMMDQPLLISELLRHADRHHGSTEIVSKTLDGPIHRYTYRDAHRRARRLAKAREHHRERQGEPRQQDPASAAPDHPSCALKSW